MRLFSSKNRPAHLGPFPLERLARSAAPPQLQAVAPMQPLSFDDADAVSLSHAMARFIAMFDLVRDGPLQAAAAEIPDDLVERANHLMDGVFAAAGAEGWAETALHREYFSVLEAPDWVNHAFTLQLARSGRTLQVPGDQSATEMMSAAGIALITKCSDGLCGTCATPYDAAASDAVEHRDYVLSQAERATRVILCCSRAEQAGGRIVLDL